MCVKKEEEVRKHNVKLLNTLFYENVTNNGHYVKGCWCCVLGCLICFGFVYSVFLSFFWFLFYFSSVLP